MPPQRAKPGLYGEPNPYVQCSKTFEVLKAMMYPHHPDPDIPPYDSYLKHTLPHILYLLSVLPLTEFVITLTTTFLPLLYNEIKANK